MRILVIDTATQALSVALIERGEAVAHVHNIVGRGHAEALLPAIANLPGGGRADLIAVDVGPGSFTGVRIGIAAARALGFAWSIPVQGYSAFALLAAMAARSHGDGPVAITMTGGHGDLFWQMFDASGTHSLTEPASTPIPDLARSLTMPTCYGTGAEALVTARGFGEAVLLYPDARCHPMIAARDALPPSPVYGRGVDARPMAQFAPQ